MAVERDDNEATMPSQAKVATPTPSSQAATDVDQHGTTLPAAPPNARTEPSPGPQIGRFRVESRLGAGGMAVVYRAYDPALDRAVALKVLRVRGEGPGHPGDTQGQRRRVLREARAAAALTHPNTVTIFDVGEADGEVFIAMELLAGETLRTRMRRETDLDRKIRWLSQAATALAAAHERGMVHRDVKPDNMFICSPGDTLKLLDFGIAKRDEAAADEDDSPYSDPVDSQPDSIGPSSLRTEAGVLVGTPRYMAPEQRIGDPTDARTDQYAWGLVAFELLTGTHPVGAPETVTKGGPAAPAMTPENVAERLANTAGVTPKLAAAIARTLELRKDARFPSMVDVLAELDTPPSSLGAQGTLATSTRPAAIEKPSRRGWLVIAAVLGLAGVGGTAAALHGKLRGGPAAPAPVPPACRLTYVSSIPIGEDDRVGPLPNGDLAIARNTREGLTVKRIAYAGDAGTGAGVEVPVTRHPAALGLMGVFATKADYDDLSLNGVRLEGGPWVFAAVDQGIPRGYIILGMADNTAFTQRLTPPVSGLVIASLGKQRMLFAVTTPDAGERFGNLPSGAEIYISSPNKAPRPINIEIGDTYLPALATSSDDSRIAFAYALVDAGGKPQQHLQLAILDENGERVGPIKTIRSAPAVYPSVAFSGPATASVFWVEDLGKEMRLRTSSYAPGDADISPARNAVDEIVMTHRPVTARLPNGDWAAAWVGVQKNTPTLRVAPVRAGGELVGPISVSPLSSKFERLSASASDRGVILSWRETDAGGARMAKIAEVTCP